MERAEAYGFSGAMSGSFLLSCLLFAAVSRRQRGPYMDEVFHVPQAQAYCHGRFLQVRAGLGCGRPKAGLVPGGAAAHTEFRALRAAVPAAV